MTPRQERLITPENKIRLRVCGVCLSDAGVLLVKHKRFFQNHYFPEEAWILPGGGIDFGESLHAALQREMMEETGYSCRVGDLLFVKELIYPFDLPIRVNDTSQKQIHSLTLGFECEIESGELITGKDPEFKAEEQLILQTAWLSEEDMNREILYPPFLKDYLISFLKTRRAPCDPRVFTSVE